MRTYSTPQSALNGEITKLAIIECIASVALYVGIGVYFGTFRYLAVAVVFAPLMLFRTEFSVIWGLNVYKRCLGNLLSLKQRVPESLFLLVAVICVPLIGAAIRIAATTYWAVRRPLQTLKDMPQNWLRQSLCTDVVHPPEIVPLDAIQVSNEEMPTFTVFLENVRAEKTGMRIVVMLIYLPVIILGWLPSLIYRVSFKATALAYAPLVWVAHATLRKRLSVKARLERITKGELEKVRWHLSWIILTTLAAKVALAFNWIDRSYIESKFPSQKIVTSFVILGDWPWWQITLGTEALLTCFLLFFADAALARLDDQQPWREEFVLQTVSTVSFLRAALSIVTISYFFYMACIAAAPDSVRRLLTY